MNASTTLIIEGHEMVVSVYREATGAVVAEFADAADLLAYELADGPIDSPWVRLIGFMRPIEAMKQIGAEVLRLGAGNEIEFEGATGKRASVYAKLLSRAGIKSESFSRAGQEALRVFAPA